MGFDTCSLLSLDKGTQTYRDKLKNIDFFRTLINHGAVLRFDQKFSPWSSCFCLAWKQQLRVQRAPWGESLKFCRPLFIYHWLHCLLLERAVFSCSDSGTIKISARLNWKILNISCWNVDTILTDHNHDQPLIDDDVATLSKHCFYVTT